MCIEAVGSNGVNPSSPAARGNAIVETLAQQIVSTDIALK